MNIMKASLFLSRSISSSSLVKKLDFYYDVISPYSWFAYEVLQRYKKHWNIDVEFHPVLLGGVLKSAVNAPPLTVPSKANYTNRDVVLCRKYFDIPVVPLKDILVLLRTGSLAPMRFLTAVKMYLPQYLDEANRAFWMIRWNKDEDFTTPQALKDVCNTCKMTDDETKLILEKIKSDEVKSALKKTCQGAVELKMFGVPTTVIHKNGEKLAIFGSDRFPIIAQELDVEWKGPNPDKTTKL